MAIRTRGSLAPRPALDHGPRALTHGRGRIVWVAATMTDSADSLAFVEELYARFHDDPGSVPPDWRDYFLTLGNGADAVRLGPSFRAPGVFAPARIDIAPPMHVEDAALQDRIVQLVRAYRVRGHLIARVD